MIPASVRLSWATSSIDRRGLAGLAAAIAVFTFGITFAAVSGSSNPRVVFWCAGVVAAALVGMDFPGPGHARWSEFELSLPVPPRERARARLLVSLTVWLLPLLVGLVVARFVAGPQFSLVTILPGLASASACVVLAAALRHTAGLHTSGLSTAVLRALMAAVVIAGFGLPFTAVSAVALLTALPLLAIAHRNAARTPEMRVSSEAAEQPVAEYTVPGAADVHAPSDDTASERGTTGPTTLEQVALRYSLRSGYALTMLVATLLWAFGVTAGWLPSIQGGFLMLFVMNHTLWSTRLLRLGHLPYPRAQLFRFVAWPPLAAAAIGVSLGLALAPPNDLCRIEAKNGGVTLKSEERYFRFAAGQPPLVTAPNGESHQPVARRFGLGSALVVYDPYETSPTASRSFLVHQLGRLLADQRGLSLDAVQIDRRFLADFEGHRRLDDKRYPELRDARALSGRVVTALTLLLAALLVMFTIVQPGAARDPHGWQRGAGTWIVMAVFLAAPLLQVASILAKTGVNPMVVAVAAVQRPLAEHVLLAVPAAIALGVVFYRSLLRRFERMEAPLRAKVYDSWFVEI